MTEKPKMYFVCDGKGDWWTCYGVLSNGFCFGQHICSRPGYAPSDLYFRRKERVEALEKIFGFTWELPETEVIVVSTHVDIPEWWAAHEALQEGLKDTYDRYNVMLNGPQVAKVEITTDEQPEASNAG